MGEHISAEKAELLREIDNQHARELDAVFSAGAAPAPVPPLQTTERLKLIHGWLSEAYEQMPDDPDDPVRAAITNALGTLDLMLAGAPSAPAPSQAEVSNDDEFVPHAFVSRTPYEPGDDRDIWCRDCEWHRDNQIHSLAPAPSPHQTTDEP